MTVYNLFIDGIEVNLIWTFLFILFVSLQKFTEIIHSHARKNIYKMEFERLSAMQIVWIECGVVFQTVSNVENQKFIPINLFRCFYSIFFLAPLHYCHFQYSTFILNDFWSTGCMIKYYKMSYTSCIPTIILHTSNRIFLVLILQLRIWKLLDKIR